MNIELVGYGLSAPARLTFHPLLVIVYKLTEMLLQI